MAELCKHGMDRRFCSLCTRGAAREPSSIMASRASHLAHVFDHTGGEKLGLDDIVACLNAAQVRATYGAVAALVGGIAQSIGARLGGLEGQRREASWVVNAKTGLPTGYPAEHRHPALLNSSDIISTGDELWRRLAEWKAAGAPSRSTTVDAPNQRQPHSPSEPERASPALSVDELADLRRKLTVLLNSLDTTRSVQSEGIRKRINRLSHDGGPIPRAMAALMATITEMRNSAEYESKVLSVSECAVVRHAWQAIQEWAQSVRRA
jgi:hypothetical protein